MPGHVAADPILFLVQLGALMLGAGLFTVLWFLVIRKRLEKLPVYKQFLTCNVVFATIGGGTLLLWARGWGEGYGVLAIAAAMALTAGLSMWVRLAALRSKGRVVRALERIRSYLANEPASYEVQERQGGTGLTHG